MDKQTKYSIIKLNLARHCLNYLIEACHIKELYIPYYICPTIWQNIKRGTGKCRIKFYHIDNNFYPLACFDKKDYIVYPNYFGINWKNVEQLAAIYPNLIVDNAQAFFAPPSGIASFYSLRKFFPLPSGAYLYTKYTYNANYPDDITVYKDFFFPDYKEFAANEQYLNKQPPLFMSSSLKLPADLKKEQRLENFYKLHNKYKTINELEINLTANDIPFVYPCLTEQAEKLVSLLNKEGKIILRYWNKLPQEYPEYKFYSKLVPIPLD